MQSPPPQHTNAPGNYATNIRRATPSHPKRIPVITLALQIHHRPPRQRGRTRIVSRVHSTGSAAAELVSHVLQHKNCSVVRGGRLLPCAPCNSYCHCMSEYNKNTVLDCPTVGSYFASQAHEETHGEHRQSHPRPGGVAQNKRCHEEYASAMLSC
jgi:hypothetical protein